MGYIANASDELVAKFRLQHGDILFSHINSEPQIGRAVVYTGQPEKLLHGMNLLRLRVDHQKLLPQFLAYVFKQYREDGVFIGIASRAVGQSSINQGRLKSLKVPLPTLHEQGSIVGALSAVQKATTARQDEKKLFEELYRVMLHDFMSMKLSASSFAVDGGYE